MPKRQGLKEGGVKFTRPGVEAAVRLSQTTLQLLAPADSLFISTTAGTAQPSSNRTVVVQILDIWDHIEEQFVDMLHKKGGDKLVQLTKDCTEIGKKLRSSFVDSKPMDDNDTQKTKDKKQVSINFTKQDLMTVIQWKFLKGKPRYALMKQIESNDAKEIQRCTSNALIVANKLLLTATKSDEQQNEDDDDDVQSIVQESVDAFAQLRGIGPATASALLCYYMPEYYTFMDDEIIEALIPNKQRAYTTSRYLEVNAICTQLANVLNQNMNHHTKTTTADAVAKESWTPYRVGNVLWTSCKLASIEGCIDLTLKIVESKSKKTMHDNNEDENNKKKKAKQK